MVTLFTVGGKALFPKTCYKKFALPSGRDMRALDMNRTRLTMGLMLTTALAAPALAQDDQPYQLDEIVIYYGALEPQSADKTAQAVTVLSKKDMERSGETRLSNLIAQTPGVGILARGPMGAQTGFTIRGVSQNYVKVLVDGIDVSDPSAPQVATDLGRLNTFNFDRVEIMRGTQSALYGGSAVAGVINLDTPRPTEEGVSQSVALELGSYKTANFAYNFGWKQGDDELSIQLSKIYTAGFSAADEKDGNTEKDGYKADRVSLRAQKRVSDNLLIGFAGFAQNDRGEYDETAFDPVTYASYPVDGTPDEVTDAKTRGARLFAQFETGPVSQEVALSYFRLDRHTAGSTALYGPTYYNYVGKRRKFEWLGHAEIGNGKASFGFDRTLENYTSNSTYGGSDAFTSVTGIFAEYAFAPVEGVNVIASARHDQLSSFGDQTTGRLGVTWRAAPDTLLKVSLGNGYRAPSGYELYGPYGDATLRPEKSISGDFGIEQKFGAHTLTATLFRIDVKDLIDYADPAYYQTSGTATRQGVELGMKGPITGNIGYSLGYTYLDKKNPSGLSSGSTWNSAFGRHTLTAGIDAKVTDTITLAADMRIVTDRQDQPDYGLLNAQMTYDLGSGKEAYLRIENVTDTDYQLWPGYGTSGRAAYVGLRARF